jgi:hypothetical protein
MFIVVFSQITAAMATLRTKLACPFRRGGEAPARGGPPGFFMIAEEMRRVFNASL